MAAHRLALIIQNPSNDDEFLLVKQSRPPKFQDEEYDSFVDSDLWDLPSAQLNPLQAELEPPFEVEIADSHSEEVNLREFDIRSALNEVFRQIGFGAVEGTEWKFYKYAKEAAFGPGLPVNTVFIVGKLIAEDKDFRVYDIDWGVVQKINVKQKQAEWETCQGLNILHIHSMWLTSLVSQNNSSILSDTERGLEFSKFGSNLFLLFSFLSSGWVAD